MLEICSFLEMGKWVTFILQVQNLTTLYGYFLQYFLKTRLFTDLHTHCNLRYKDCQGPKLPWNYFWPIHTIKPIPIFSDDRSVDVFKNKLESSTQMKSVLTKERRPNCLVIDEIDGAPAVSLKLCIIFFFFFFNLL